jgi:outer membrane biosynthesis protein TonB
MYFDFGDGHPDFARLPRALTAREEVLVAIIVHLLVIIGLLVGPRLPWVKARMQAAEQALLAAAEQLRERQRQETPFIFVEPRIDIPAKRPPVQAPLSDQDRQAMTRERPIAPKNNQPLSHGNTKWQTEATPPPSPPPRGQPAPPALPQPESTTASNDATLRLPDNGLEAPTTDATRQRPDRVPPGTPTGLASALRNLDRYVEEARRQGQFDNSTGGGQYGQSFQFDSKGVEFGPWLARFKAQVYRNWYIPQAAYFLKGHVSITLNIHRSGAITDIQVVAPSSVDGFNNSSYNALAASNPTVPLPTAYPDDVLRMTVTFFYNEEPPFSP